MEKQPKSMELEYLNGVKSHELPSITDIFTKFISEQS